MLITTYLEELFIEFIVLLQLVCVYIYILSKIGYILKFIKRMKNIIFFKTLQPTLVGVDGYLCCLGVNNLHISRYYRLCQLRYQHIEFCSGYQRTITKKNKKRNISVYF